MDESFLPNSINPNTFPAKLWRLVNNPANKAICWDIEGQVIVIDQQLCETQILSPSTHDPDNEDAFKTTHFSSFVRQLNLYGFRKLEAQLHPCASSPSAMYHYFYSPHFKRNHPELVANLRRLTVVNKAKIQAGLQVKNKPPSRYMRFRMEDARNEKMKGGSHAPPSASHKPSPHPYHPNKAQVMMSHNRTPVPPPFLIRPHATAITSTFLAAERGTPLSKSHHYTDEALCSTAMHIQQGLTFTAPNSQCQPSCYSPFFQYYHSNIVASHVTSSALQTSLFSPQYYQARNPVNALYNGNLGQNSKDKEDQEVKKYNIPLDNIFQIADEVMQIPATTNLVKVVTPEKPGPVPFPDPSSSTLNASPLSPGSLIIAVSPNADLVTYEQQEESVVSIPEQMPEVAEIEVVIDDENDSEVINVEIGDSLKDSSQADTCSCTGSTPNK